MKKKKFLNTAVICIAAIAAVSAFVFTACKKEEGKQPQNPEQETEENQKPDGTHSEIEKEPDKEDTKEKDNLTYKNTQYGYEMEYPSIFSEEDKANSTDESCFFNTKDGKAVLSIRFMDLPGLSVEEYEKQLKENFEDGTVLLQNEQEIRFSEPYSDSMMLVLHAFVTEKGVYQWEMNYPKLEKDSYEPLFNNIRLDITNGK